MKRSTQHIAALILMAFISAFVHPNPTPVFSAEENEAPVGTSIECDGEGISVEALTFQPCSADCNLVCQFCAVESVALISVAPHDFPSMDNHLEPELSGLRLMPDPTPPKTTFL